MNMIEPSRYRILGMAICCILLLFTPVIAADPGIERTLTPVSPNPGELVNVTILVPPAFFGGIIEQLPDGFTFGSTSHPQAGVQQSGNTIIFAVTGENIIRYTIRAPVSGCGEITGRWENVGTKATGTVPSTVISVAGTDPSRCSPSQHSPGFDMITALGACSVGALLLVAGRMRR